jgi:CHAT domain-containing protein
VEDLQRWLKPTEAVFSVVLLSEQTVLLAVTPQQYTLQTVPVAQREIDTEVRAVRGALQPGALFALDPARLQRLYQWLLEPVAATLATARTVFVVADGALYNLPLELLVRDLGGENSPRAYRAARRHEQMDFYATLDYLDHHYRFQYLPSLAAFIAQRQHPKPAVPGTATFIAFADPLFAAAASNPLEAYAAAGTVRGSTLAPLPETATEVQAIATRFPPEQTRLYLGREAQERTVKQLSVQDRLQGLRYLHFATHGLLGGELLKFLADRPTPALTAEPALALTPTGEPDNDGFLTMSEVLGLNLNTDWVLLSACNTAGESASQGEGFVGLTRSFLYAGARHLLVSHWPVASQATRDLMIDTFTRLQPPLSLPDALAAARHRLRQEPATAHPFFWAPFVVVGD